MLITLLTQKNSQNKTTQTKPKILISHFPAFYFRGESQTLPQSLQNLQVKGRAVSAVTSRQSPALCSLPRMRGFGAVRALQRGGNSVCTQLCQTACTSSCCTEIGVSTECFICIQVLESCTAFLGITEGEQWCLPQELPISSPLPPKTSAQALLKSEQFKSISSSLGEYFKWMQPCPSLVGFGWWEMSPRENKPGADSKFQKSCWKQTIIFMLILQHTSQQLSPRTQTCRVQFVQDTQVLDYPSGSPQIFNPWSRED